MRLAVIPARGGSKRIPRKNIRIFAGLPIIAYSIATARESGLFDRIIVSTEDEEIGRMAASHGAEVPFVRPSHLADDHAGTVGVISHAVRWASEVEQMDLEAVCCIYATAPFARAEDLAAGLHLLMTGNWQFVVSAAEYPAPVFRGFIESQDGGIEMLFPEHAPRRSQDVPPVLHDAAQFYWGRAEAWLSETGVLAPTSTCVRLPQWRVIDIDTPEDWARAELLWRVMNAAEQP